MRNSFLLLSKHRQALMGFAIIWILLVHLGMSNLFLKIKPVYYFLIAGHSGVDIFLFLSGFGLYFSSLKPASTLQFYIKRFTRIYPAFIIARIIIHLLHQDISLIDMLLALSTVNYWTQSGTFDWYLSALVAIYIVFPLYIILFKKQPLLCTTIISIIAITVVVMMSLNDPSTPDMRKLFFSRIPIFCIGAFCGMLATYKEKRFHTTKYISYILAIVGFTFYCFIATDHPGYLWFGFAWFPFILVTPGLCLLLSTILDKLSPSSHINKTLRFMGSITLETYLMHSIVYGSFKISLIPSHNILDFFIECGIKVILSIGTAYLLHLLCDRIINKVEKVIFRNNSPISDI